ncbi:MAG: hypothetical protein ACI80V_000030 [Rhodothermales bacterium]|jgi:hypothetical protein
MRGVGLAEVMAPANGLSVQQIREFPPKQQIHRPEWEPHDVIKVALNAVNEERTGVILDSVRASLVHRRTPGHVARYFDRGQVAKGHRCFCVGRATPPSLLMDKGDTRVDGMGARREAAEHLPGVGFINRLSQDLAFQYDNGVCTQDQGLGVPGRNTRGFVRGEILDQFYGVGTGGDDFWGVAGNDIWRET